MEVEYYEDRRGFRPVKQFVDLLTHRTEVNQVTSHLRELKVQGFRLQRPMAAPLRDGVYELRPGPLRILYGYDQGVIILLHVFRKKTRDVPDEDIELAIKRLMEWRQI